MEEGNERQVHNVEANLQHAIVTTDMQNLPLPVGRMGDLTNRFVAALRYDKFLETSVR